MAAALDYRHGRRPDFRRDCRPACRRLLSGSPRCLRTGAPVAAVQLAEILLMKQFCKKKYLCSFEKRMQLGVARWGNFLSSNKVTSNNSSMLSLVHQDFLKEDKSCTYQLTLCLF